MKLGKSIYSVSIVLFCTLTGFKQKNDTIQIATLPSYKNTSREVTNNFPTYFKMTKDTHRPEASYRKQKIEIPALAGTLSPRWNDMNAAINTPTSTSNDLPMKSLRNLNYWEQKDGNAVVYCKNASNENHGDPLSETDTTIRDKDSRVRLKTLQLIIFLIGILIWKSSRDNQMNWA